MSREQQTTVATTGGITFGGLLSIVFITLKLLKVIEWSWVWVLAPLWIPLSITFIILAIAIILLGRS